jgi:hypothetical protein
MSVASGACMVLIQIAPSTHTASWCGASVAACNLHEHSYPTTLTFTPEMQAGIPGVPGSGPPGLLWVRKHMLSLSFCFPPGPHTVHASHAGSSVHWWQHASAHAAGSPPLGQLKLCNCVLPNFPAYKHWCSAEHVGGGAGGADWDAAATNEAAAAAA